MTKKNKSGNFKTNYLLIISFFVGAAIISIFLLYTNTYENRCLYSAKELLKGYKTSQAITVLENLRLQIKRKNPELDFLLFYAYVESNQLNKARKLLHDLSDIDFDYETHFQKIINKLNVQDEDKMVSNLIKKSKAMNLSEDFFINLSEQKNSIIEETSTIEFGIKHLKHDESAVNNLKRYLVKRLLEIEASLENDADSARALKYLEKARKLAIQINEKSFEEDIHYRLGIAYRNVKNFEKAKEHLTLSAKLGNENALKLLN
jgi:tetratricopeptide (TPR) repeat protein